MKLNHCIRKVLLICLAALSGCAEDNASDNAENDGGPKTGDSDSEGETSATLVTPIDRGGVYVLELTDGTDTVLFESVPAGGLITKFQLNGQEMISQIEGAHTSGSTFWPSPQSWGWPPSAALYTDEYTVAVEAETNTIVMTSPVDDTLGLQVIKRFSPDLADMAINLNYALVNTDTEQKEHAPWEVTRVLAGGLTFFPTGEGPVDNTQWTRPNISDAAGVTWLSNTETEVGDNPNGEYKLFADGGAGGWLAHAYNGLVFVKTFADVAADAAASGEAEIEVYIKGRDYQEVEQQGAVHSIPVGGELVWDVKWFLRSMPAAATQAVGDQSLADFAASLAGN